MIRKKTIGLPNRNTNHAEQIALLALEFIDWTTHFKIEHMPNIPLRIRVGIHTGNNILLLLLLKECYPTN